MDVVAFDGIDREVVYSDDDTSVLYVRWTISVVATLNPGVAYGRGLSPTAADVLTRSRLWTPRQKLFLLSPSGRGGGSLAGITQVTNQSNASSVPPPYEVLLECPRRFPGAIKEPESDAKDGPTPLHLDITQIHGTGTFLIRYVIRCCQTPDPVTQSLPPSPIGAHRWQMSFSSDDDFFVTRRIGGVVTFRKDMLDAYGLDPDDFRAVVCHPIPLGFKRTQPVVSLSPDGTVMEYQISDVQQANNFNPFTTGAVQIDVNETTVFQRGNQIVGQDAVSRTTNVLQEMYDNSGSMFSEGFGGFKNRFLSGWSRFRTSFGNLTGI